MRASQGPSTGEGGVGSVVCSGDLGCFFLAVRGLAVLCLEVRCLEVLMRGLRRGGCQGGHRERLSEARQERLSEDRHSLEAPQKFYESLWEF